MTGLDKLKRVYYDMLRRCYSPKYHRFDRYGGRGIRVCVEWRNSFIKFKNDMGYPKHNETLERSNNDFGYSKKNCCWASVKDQSRNRRTNAPVVQVALSGEIINMFETVVEAAEATNTNKHSIFHLINKTGDRRRKTANGYYWISLK